MTQPTATTSPRAQRLLVEAREARQIREVLTDPDVVAMRIERRRQVGEAMLWGAIGTLLIFTIITVQRFVASADGSPAPVGGLEWFGAWFMEPGIVVGLVAVLIWEAAILRQQVKIRWKTRAAKWGLLLVTYTMNTWVAWSELFNGNGHFGSVILHSAPPIIVFGLTEAREELLDLLEEAVAKSHVRSLKRRSERAERIRQEMAEYEAEIAKSTVIRSTSEVDPQPASVDVLEQTPPASASATVAAPYARVRPVGPATSPRFQATPRPPTQSVPVPEQRRESDSTRVGVPSMSYEPDTTGEVRTGNGYRETDRRTDTVPTTKALGNRTTGRSAEVQRQRDWVHAQLDAGKEVTGATLDRHFGNSGRNGSRLVASVKRERERTSTNS